MIRTLRKFVELLIVLLIVHWLFYDSGIEWSPMFAQLAWLVGMGMGYLLGQRIARLEHALSADGTPIDTTFTILADDNRVQVPGLDLSPYYNPFVVTKRVKPPLFEENETQR